jgi:pimeloyl-ACP methyl ester carboxylesterase
MPGYTKSAVDFAGGAGRLAGDRWTPDGPPRGVVLLLHGGGQTRHSWREAGPTLAEDGWTAIAIDFRGHGDSDRAADGRYRVDAMTEDVLRVIDAIGEPPVIIGASLGGLTGLVIAGEHPAALRALVLVDSVPRIERSGTRRIFEFMRSAPGGFGSLEEAAEAVRAYQPHRVRPVNLDGMRKNVRLAEDGRWYWHWDPKMMQPPDWAEMDRLAARTRGAAAAVRVPVLLVRGQLSDVVSEEGAADLLATIPHARYTDVAGTGHMVAGDDNSVFLERVAGFLDSLPSLPENPSERRLHARSSPPRGAVRDRAVLDRRRARRAADLPLRRLRPLAAPAEAGVPPLPVPLGRPGGGIGIWHGLQLHGQLPAVDPRRPGAVHARDRRTRRGCGAAGVDPAGRGRAR